MVAGAPLAHYRLPAPAHPPQQPITRLPLPLPPQRRLVLVQEYAARGDLYGIHRAMNRRMTEQQLTELVLVPFVDAMVYLHARGICHRGAARCDLVCYSCGETSDPEPETRPLC